jgi:hypothetical protein
MIIGQVSFLAWVSMAYNVEHVYVVLAFEILMLHKLVDDD